MQKERQDEVKLGRPTKYSQELVDEICATVSCSTKSLMTLCRERDHWPSYPVLYQWRKNNPDFQEAYIQAKRDQADFLAEQIVEISDDGVNDYYLDKDGKPVTDHEHLQRSRLRVDTRKWIACKMLPRMYGTNTEEQKDQGASLLEKILSGELELTHKDKK